MNDESKDVFGDSTLDLSINETQEISAEPPQAISSPKEEEPSKTIRPHQSIKVERVKDPVHVLQLSQTCFAADSDDDDDVSLIIPPTQDETVPFIIPSTPTDNECIIEESAPYLDDKNESVTEKDMSKDGPKDVQVDDDEWNKATQPLCSNIPTVDDDEDNNDETFADTEAMFTSYMDMPTQRQSTPLIPEHEDSDEWNLRLTDTQQTQSLETQPLKDLSDSRNKSEEGHASELPKVEEVCEIIDMTEDQDPTELLETQVPALDETNVANKGQGSDLEVKDETDNNEKESTPEDVRLFAEIENIVKAARESEKMSSQPTAESDLKSADDSDLDEIAPSQTTNIPLSICEKSTTLHQDTIVPETEPSAGESEEDKNDRTLQEVVETEQFGSVNVDKVEVTVVSPVVKVEKSPKALNEKSPKKVIIIPDSDIISSSEIAQTGILNGQNISASPFRQPSRFFKKTQKTPQKIKPLGKIVSDMSPKHDFKSGDIVNTSEMMSRKPNIFLHPSSVVGSFSDSKSLEEVLNTVGVSIDEEKLKNHSSPLSHSTVEKDVIRVNMTYRIYLKGDKVWEEFSHVEDECSSQSKMEVSPLNSSSTTSSTKSSFISTGEMGDISSSISSKSQSSNSSIIHNEGVFPRNDIAFPFKSFKKSALDPTSSSSQEDFKSPVEILPRKGKSTSTPLSSDSASTKGGKAKKTVRKQNRKRSTEQISSSGEFEAKRTKHEEFIEEEELSLSSNVVVARPAPKKGSTKKKTAESKKKNTRKKVEKIETKASIGEISRSVPPLPLTAQDTAGGSSTADSILPGVRVMARWKDGYYYPGIVQSLETDGRWCVEFDDGGVRTVIQENLLKVALLQVGTSVLAMSPDGYYDPGVVVSHYRDESDMGYVVEQGSGLTRRYKRGSVILSTEQAKVLTTDKPSTTLSALTTINLDNIIGGKRKRKSLQDQQEIVKPVVPPKKKSARRRINPDSNLDTTESSANEAVMSQNDIVLRIEEELRAIGEGDDTPTPIYQKPTIPQKATARVKKTSSKASRKQGKKAANVSCSDTTTTEDETSKKTLIVNQPDAVLVRSTKLFQGFAFLLTHAVKKNAEENVENFHADMTFDKEQLCKTILAAGGLALDSFEDAQKCTNRKVILLANTHLRTIKYIQCVAANISCIQQFWVQQCVRQGKITMFDNYVLPSGYSIVDDKVAEWHGNTDIFKDLKIVITSEKKSDFVNIWTPVLLAAKAELVQKWNMPSFLITGTSFLVDLIVTNASCPPSIIAAAKRGKIPVVSSEYIIQCIIVGHRLPYDAHPKFKHDFKD